MRAVLLTSTGPPAVLTYGEAPKPVPGPGEAVLRVSRCGVNMIDVWVRSGRYKTGLPRILGTDIAGVVDEVGPDAPGVKVGDEVVVYPTLTDGTCSYCRAGHPNLCAARGFVGVVADGGYAEFVKVRASNLVMSGGLGPSAAAAVPTNFATAWNGLVSRAPVGRGDTVLVWGAAGGLGHAAVQVAKLLGATVIGLVGDAGKRDFVASQGADHVLVHAGADLGSEVRALTEGLGASVVFDQVGGETWGRSLECLARGGTLLTVGLTSGLKSEVDVRRVYQDQLRVVGVYSYTKSDLARVLGLASQGKLKPSIFSEMPLSMAPGAHETLESRRVQGKILLVP